jgi:hypothetical protein
MFICTGYPFCYKSESYIHCYVKRLEKLHECVWGGFYCGTCLLFIQKKAAPGPYSQATSGHATLHFQRKRFPILWILRSNTNKISRKYRKTYTVYCIACHMALLEGCFKTLTIIMKCVFNITPPILSMPSAVLLRKIIYWRKVIRAALYFRVHYAVLHCTTVALTEESGEW